MEIKYNVKLPPRKLTRGGVKCEETLAIEDFLTSGNVETTCFEYEYPEKAKSKASTIRSHRKIWNKNHPDKPYMSFYKKNTIYVCKGES